MTRSATSKPPPIASYEPTPTAPAPPTWEALSALRWGPAVADRAPGIDIPRDWRDAVAAWPHERWVRWRRLSAEAPAGDPAEGAPGPTTPTSV